MIQDSASVDIYMKEISETPVLTREEEINLFKRLEADDESARGEIIRSNLRFVVKIANSFSGQGMPVSDMIQEGNIGLMDVIDKFDYHKGYRFSTYAAFWIRQAIQMALRKQRGMTRLPVRKSRMLGYINDMIYEFNKIEGREPSMQEIGEALGLEEDQLNQLMSLRKSWCSLDEEQNDDHKTLLDSIADDDQKSPREVCEENQMKTHVSSWVKSSLSDREKKIIGLRFGFINGKSYSLRNTSRFVGLSQEGVRRIEKKALIKLRRPALACVA